MSLWWLQPGWKDAMCLCGANIWQSGGDPDMGICYDCYFARQEPERRYPEPMCDICKVHPACAGSNGYDVCSAECDAEAQSREARDGVA